MFSKLVASQSEGRRAWSSRAVTLSVATHLLLVAGAVWATTIAPAPRTEQPEEEVTFLEVEEAEPEAPEAPEPPPPPETPPATPPPPQGFQELLPPEVPPAVIPPPDLTQEAVNPADFTGIGEAGGRAEGVEGGVPSNAAPDSTPVFTLEETGVKPEIVNLREVQRILERNYPRQYADAGVAGQVQVKFLIDEEGRVAPGSVTVVTASHEAFGEAASRAVERFRFRPIVYRGAPVRVWVTMPIGFQPVP